MDNQDNHFPDSLNPFDKPDTTENQASNNGSKTTRPFPSAPSSEDEFEGILSNTIFSESGLAIPLSNPQTTMPKPPRPTVLEEPRYSDSFNREPNFMPAQGQTFQHQTVPGFQEPPIPVRRSKSTMWIALGVIALLLFTSILAIQAAFRSKPTGDVPVLPQPRGVNASAPSPTELSNSFREISKAVKPAVVYIEVTEKVSDEQQSPEIFGFPVPGQPRRRQSAGSGFVVTNDGYIITNNHVVDKASKIEVTLSDNRKYKATVIGTDRETDLAVIKVDETGLPVAILGNSDEVQQGDWVLALGSPFGLQQTLTAGIVSATGRENPNTQLGRFIQTDASINPGNSGGPLISMNAEVIGINSFILSQPGAFSEQGGNIGIGFAVTSNIAREVFNEIVKKGKVSRGYLGVNPRELDAPLARSYGVEPHSGVLISNLPGPDTPAAKAGLKVGDIITTFDGKKVTTPRELTDAVTATPVGKSCTVDFLRDGNPMSVTVVLAERPSELTAVRPQPDNQTPEADPASATAKHLGIGVQEVTPEMAARMNLTINSGVMVQRVAPNSPAAEAGIRHGDVIHRVDRTVVKTGADLQRADALLKTGDKISVQIERGGRILFLEVTME